MAKVKHKVGILGSIDSIYQSLVTNDGLSGWWASSASGRTEVGSQIDLTFSELAVLRFEYDELQSIKTVRLRCVSGPGPWKGSELLFDL
jgi:hypothetical protein